MKFPCLRKGLRVAPERACNIIIACAVLFNISKSINDPYLGRQHRLIDVEVPPYEGPGNNAGDIERERIMELIHPEPFDI
ncbi:hypothetical protein HOLleu_43487 [Holothuria leucospilota]|uniref:Uncharacterized protein n=1 Tax=Holothuria leucospilota TaxID=206669 RepID=A0A9Q0YBU4_HOLLE|nr:hypothetical protein HOLleu_43487 [Holothuria leucospilota]